VIRNQHIKHSQSTQEGGDAVTATRSRSKRSSASAAEASASNAHAEAGTPKASAAEASASRASAAEASAARASAAGTSSRAAHCQQQPISESKGQQEQARGRRMMQQGKSSGREKAAEKEQSRSDAGWCAEFFRWARGFEIAF
jgi:hypothetical protein